MLEVIHPRLLFADKHVVEGLTGYPDSMIE
jgi:hypothetical protein